MKILINVTSSIVWVIQEQTW